MNASLQSLLMALDSAGQAPRRLPTGLVSRAIELNDLRRRRTTGKTINRISKQRRSILESPRRAVNRIERQLHTLRRLVPSGESMGLNGLFGEAADYIACLETQVKVMQIMVRVLSGDSDE